MALSFKEVNKADNTIITLHPNRPNRIVVIGCGGTGGYLIPDLIRAVKFCQDNCEIVLVDGDLVESKNIKRQNFIQKDLGKNKAAIMAKRYGQAFEKEITHVDKYLETPEDLINILCRNARGYNFTQLIITCVDNNQTRLLVDQAGKLANDNRSLGRIFWLDSGNESDWGQVVLSFFSDDYNPNYGDRKQNIKVAIRAIENGYGRNIHTSIIPQLVEVFPSILEAEGSAKPEISCAEEVEENPQNILINRLAATVLLNYAYKFLYGQALSSFMTTFTTMGETRIKLLNLKNLKELWSKAYSSYLDMQNL